MEKSNVIRQNFLSFPSSVNTLLFKPTGLRPQLLERNHGIPEEERRKASRNANEITKRKIQNSDGLSLADRI